MNAYNLFIREYCGEQKMDFKKAAEQYRSITEEEKSKFVAEAERLKVVHQDAIAKYKMTLSPAALQQYEDSKRKKKVGADTSDDEKTANATNDTSPAASVQKKKTAAAAKSKKTTAKEVESSSVSMPTSPPPTVSIPSANVSMKMEKDDESSSKKVATKKRKSDVLRLKSTIKKEKIVEPEKVPS